MVDKNLSMSSYLALRYIEKPGIDFTEKLSYRRPFLLSDDERIMVSTAEEIGTAIKQQISEIRGGYAEDWDTAFWWNGLGNSCFISAWM